MKISPKIWPYSIGFSIIAVFGFCVATVFVVESANIQESNTYMTKYQEAELNANHYIKNRIAFDKKYKITYVPKMLKEESTLAFKVSDLSGKIVKNAKLTLLVSRPETHVYDQKLQSEVLKDGNYIVQNVKFAKKGLWDIIVKVEVGKYSRFYNIRVDTRNKIFTEQ